MESRAETRETEELEPLTEWEKPTVEEFDVSSTTKSGFVGTGTDNLIYS